MNLEEKYIGQKHFKGNYRGIDYLFTGQKTSYSLLPSKKPVIIFLLHIGGNCTLDMYWFRTYATYDYLLDTGMDFETAFRDDAIKHIEYFINEVA